MCHDKGITNPEKWNWQIQESLTANSRNGDLSVKVENYSQNELSESSINET